MGFTNLDGNKKNSMEYGINSIMIRFYSFILERDIAR